MNRTASRGRKEEELGTDGREVSELGSTIRAWRKCRGLSVTELAVAAGFGETGRSYISQIEHGHIIGIAGKRLQAIALALEISLEVLSEFRLPPDEPQRLSGIRFASSEHRAVFVPDDGIHEYTRVDLETSAVARWRPILDKHEATIIGVRDLPTSRGRLDINQVTFLVTRAESREYPVPGSVYARIRGLEDFGICFDYWLWAEHKIPFGAGLEANCLLIGVIATAPHRGIWCLLGKWLQ